MLQDLIRAYADAYTVALTPSRPRHEEEAAPREFPSETPAKAHRSGIWRGLFSFL